MKSLEYHFECLHGNYYLRLRNSNLHVETTLPGFTSFDEELNEQKVAELQEMLKKTDITRWDRHYDADGNGIEDAVHWYVKYEDEDGIYISSGEESFEPYNYDRLIEVMMQVDRQASYFLTQTVNE